MTASGAGHRAGAQMSLPLGWCQRWDAGVPSWRHRRDSGFDRRHYECEPIGHDVARAAVADMHYARSYPAARWAYGMFAGGRLVGVAVLGVPMRAQVLTAPFPDLSPYEESAELSRFCLRPEVPANGESWMLGRLFRWLRSDTEVRGVLAFADPHPRFAHGQLIKPGRFGVIYQAHGGRALGRSTPRTLTLLPDGTVLSARSRAKLLAGDPGLALRPGPPRRPRRHATGVDGVPLACVARCGVGRDRRRDDPSRRLFPLRVGAAPRRPFRAARALLPEA